MKILIVHEVNYLSKIIYEYQILPEIFSMLGHEVTVVDYNDSWSSEPNGRKIQLKTMVHTNVHRAYADASITVRRPGMIRIPLVSRVSGAVTLTLEVVRAMEEIRPDVLLLYGLPTVGVQSILAARSFNVPVVFRAIDVSHRLVPSKLLVWPTRTLENFVFNSVDLNIPLTPHLEKYVLNYGVSSTRVRRLPSGVDAQMFSPGPRNPACLSRWGIAADDPVLLFMGTIYRFSGLDRVISDFDKVLAGHPHAKLLILGSGEDEPRLKQLAQSAGVSKSIVFAGTLPYVDLPEIVRSTDVCINPFHLNGITENILPTKLFQYMSCRKPVVATSLPGTRVFISGEDEGVVYAELDNFNDRIVELLNDPERRARLGQKGYDAAIAYDWWNIARTMLAWLEQIRR